MRFHDYFSSNSFKPNNCLHSFSYNSNCMPFRLFLFLLRHLKKTSEATRISCNSKFSELWKINLWEIKFPLSESYKVQEIIGIRCFQRGKVNLPEKASFQQQYSWGYLYAMSECFFANSQHPIKFTLSSIHAVCQWPVNSHMLVDFNKLEMCVLLWLLGGICN